MLTRGTSPLPPLADDAWRVIYFDAPNRGEQVRLLLALAGQHFEDHRMSFPDGKVPLMSGSAGDASPLAFDLTPVVQHGSLSIGIVPGSMLYIAEKFGLVPDNSLSRALAVSLTDGSEMMRNDVFYSVFFKRRKLRREPDMLNRAPYSKWLGHFERFLRAGSGLAAGGEPGPFLLGSKICFADVAVYDCIMGIWAMDLYDQGGATLACERWPLLCALVDAVASQPGIKEFEDNRGTRRDIYAALEAKIPNKAKL